MGERPRSHRPNKSKRPSRPSKKRPSKFRFEDESSEEYDFEEEAPSRRTRPSKKATKKPTRKQRPPRPQKTTTPEPIYEEYDFEDYPSEELLDDFPLDSSYEDEISLEVKEPIALRPNFPNRRLPPKRGNSVRQQFNKDTQKPSIKAFSRPNSFRGQSSRAGRPNPQKEPSKPVIADSAIDKETRRPSFGNSNTAGSRLAASNLNAKDNNKPSIIEVTTPKAVKVETKPPLVKSKPIEKSSQVTQTSGLSQTERDKKRNELKENLLQSLLNHSKKKTDSEKATEIPKVREDSPRKLGRKKGAQRSGGFTGRKFGRGGIPSRRKPSNNLDTSERLTLKSEPKNVALPIGETNKPKFKISKDSIVENVKITPKAHASRLPDIKIKSLPAVPAVPALKPKTNEPFVPTQSPSVRGSKQPESPRSKPPPRNTNSPTPKRSQSQRPQGRRPPQSQRNQSERGQDPRSGSKRTGNTTIKETQISKTSTSIIKKSGRYKSKRSSS